MRSRASIYLGAAGLAALLLSGCATFHALPLDNGRGVQRITDIEVPAASLPIPALRAHTFDPANGLDVTETAMLAVANNPQLKVQRDAVGVAHAQAYAAGLLPDPQLSYSRDYPTGNQPGTTVAFTEGLGIDLGNLVTRSARVRAARAGVREVDLNLLWGEWQTIAQARILFDQVHYLRLLVARLERERSVLAPVQASVTHALRRDDLTYEMASTGLNAASNAATQLADARRRLNQAEHALHNLLGLSESVPLRLTGAPFSVQVDAARVQKALIEMPKRRPDLLALQAGYAAQNAQLRSAILAQFPAITVGFARARDNSNVSSAGFSIGLSLPLFSGNRGHIAETRATRQQLHDAYSARLLTDRNDVLRMADDLRTDHAERAELVADAERLDRARAAAESTYAAGRLDWPTYLAIRADSLAVDTALLTLEENSAQTAIALNALVGPWPSAGPAQRVAHATPTTTRMPERR